MKRGLALRDLQPISVVCNDAGAANLLIYYLSNYNNLEMIPYMTGPAKNIWKNHFPKLEITDSLETALEKSKVAITGTGWMTDLEYDARMLAQEMSIKSIAILDNWTNYNSRFIRNKKKILPDELWVFDEYALKKATIKFPNILTILKQNHYLESMVKSSKLIKKPKIPYLLYLTQPMGSNWGKGVAGEFQALDLFLHNIENIVNSSKYDLVLRLHPSETEQKYKEFLKKYDVTFTFDDSDNISTAIGRAQWVVGCDTYAMAIALSAGKEVFTSIPSWGPNSNLPHNGIKSLRFTGA